MNRHETAMIKGFAILLVLCHHLFAFPERLPQGTRVLFLAGFPGHKGTLEMDIAAFGKIAVPVFLFLTGYGFYRRLSGTGARPTRYAFAKICGFVKAYWLCFAVFVPVGLLIPGSPAYSAGPKEWFLNLLAMSHSLNWEWWFVKLYLEILMVAPVVFWLVVRFPTGTLAGSALLFLAVTNGYPELWVMVMGTPLGRLFDVAGFAMWQLAFCMGMVFARFPVIEAFRSEYHLERRRIVGCVFLLLSVLVWMRGDIGTYWLSMPLLVLAVPPVLQLCRLAQPFELLGRYCLYMWLTHTFYSCYYFPSVVFAVRSSFLIAMWLVALSLGTSVVLLWLETRVVDTILRRMSDLARTVIGSRDVSLPRTHLTRVGVGGTKRVHDNLPSCEK